LFRLPLCSALTGCISLEINGLRRRRARHNCISLKIKELHAEAQGFTAENFTGCCYKERRRVSAGRSPAVSVSRCHHFDNASGLAEVSGGSANVLLKNADCNTRSKKRPS
jgi:hypothetical protein